MALIAVFTTASIAQQRRPQTSTFDPGIRSETSASIQAEKIAAGAWFAHLQMLASDNLNGRKTGTPDFIRAVEYVDARAAAQRNDIEVQFDKQPDENRFIRSDQASFVKYGIPALAFKFGWLPDSAEQKTFNDWIRNRYHHPNDDLEQPIDREGAVHFDRVLLTLVTRVANASNRPAWYPDSFFSTIPRR